MNKMFFEKMKQSLLAEKNALLNKSRLDQDIDTDGDETDEIQANLLISINNQLSSRDLLKVSEIDNALKRISEKTYGTCEDCGEDIPEKRLSINPYFLTCICCAEERELSARQNKRF
jgi:DnaK suppressor protein